MTIFNATRKCIMASLVWFICVVPVAAFELDSHDAFVVEDVPVRAVVKPQAASGDARQSAVEVGAGHAFMQLAIDILTNDDFARLPLFSYRDIQPTIRGYQVSHERSVSGQYHAKISYAFYKQKVEALLEQHDIILAEHHKDPILVIPLLQWEDEFLLWQGENPWQNAWNRVAENHKSWFINVPIGDVDDLANIHISDVLSKDFTILKTLQDRYDSRYLVIAEARIEGQELQVDMDVLAQGRDAHYSSHYGVFDDTDISQLMYRASFDASRYLDQFRTKRSDAPKWYETQAQLVADSGKARVELLGYFDNLRLIEEVSIQEVSDTGILVLLRHTDPPATLKAYLDNEGFEVLETEQTWQVRQDYEQSKNE